MLILWAKCGQNSSNKFLKTIKKRKSFRLLLLLIENDIPIPEDLINKYINKARMSKLDIELPFNINDYSTGWWILIKQAFKQIAKYFKLYTFKKY